MRIAVISDVHGDLDSLRQVLTAIDRAATEQIWCLGDIVGLGATAPAEVVNLVRDRCALALAGNHDRWVTGQLSLSMLPLPRQRGQLQWQHRVLSSEQLTWLAALPDPGLGSRHRALARQRPGPNHRLDLKPARRGRSSRPPASPDRARRHTHRPLLAENNGTTIEYDENPDTHDLADDRRAVLNPGAVGSRRWLELDRAAGNAIWHTA